MQEDGGLSIVERTPAYSTAFNPQSSIGVVHSSPTVARAGWAWPTQPRENRSIRIQARPFHRHHKNTEQTAIRTAPVIQGPTLPSCGYVVATHQPPPTTMTQ